MANLIKINELPLIQKLSDEQSINVYGGTDKELLGGRYPEGNKQKPKPIKRGDDNNLGYKDPTALFP